MTLRFLGLWERALRRQSGLSPATIRTLTRLSSQADPEGKSVSLPYRALASHPSTSFRRVQRGIRDGWLSKVGQSSTGANIYRLSIPANGRAIDSETLGALERMLS